MTPKKSREHWGESDASSVSSLPHPDPSESSVDPEVMDTDEEEAEKRRYDPKKIAAAQAVIPPQKVLSKRQRGLKKVDLEQDEFGWPSPKEVISPNPPTKHAEQKFRALRKITFVDKSGGVEDAFAFNEQNKAAAPTSPA